VAYISGDNLVGRYGSLADSYYFSRIGGIWGWATWRSEWRRYDRHLGDWPELRKQRMLEEVFDEPKAVEFGPGFSMPCMKTEGLIRGTTNGFTRI